MNKKIILIVIPVILSFLLFLFLVFYIFFLNDYLFKRKLPGEILLTSLEGYDGISIYNPSKDKLERFLDGRFITFIEYDKERNTFLTRKINNIAIDDETIVEIDVTNKKVIDLLESKVYNSSTDNFYTVPKYFPQSQDFAFFQDYFIKTYDRNNKKLETLTNTENNKFSYFKDGNSIIYNDKYDSISIFNIKTKEKTYYTKGNSPELSYDKKYLAYYNEYGELVVQNFITKKIWTTNVHRNGSMIAFSPDNNYILVSEPGIGLVSNPIYKVYVVDYKTGRRVTLFNGNRAAPGIAWR